MGFAKIRYSYVKVLKYRYCVKVSDNKPDMGQILEIQSGYREISFFHIRINYPGPTLFEISFKTYFNTSLSRKYSD